MIRLKTIANVSSVNHAGGVSRAFNEITVEHATKKQIRRLINQLELS
jgi:hypothetical protein